jgi:hypothetical protein
VRGRAMPGARDAARVDSVPRRPADLEAARAAALDN